MLEVARPDHLDVIASLVRSGAAAGSWDPALAEPGAALDALMSKLHRALADGFLRQIDPRTGALIETHIGGYVYRVEAGAPLVGFGLFKDFTGEAFELWLVGIDEGCRGRGYGRAMLGELLATPLGARTELVRCAWASAGARRCAHVLRSCGFAPCRATTSEEWLLHQCTPDDVVRRIRTMDMTPYEAVGAARERSRTAATRGRTSAPN